MTHIVCICHMYRYVFLLGHLCRCKVFRFDTDFVLVRFAGWDGRRLPVAVAWIYWRCIESSHVTLLYHLTPEVVPFPQSLGNGQELGHPECYRCHPPNGLLALCFSKHSVAQERTTLTTPFEH